MANQESIKLGLEYIAGAIGQISATDAGIRALIANGNVITTLIFMAKKINTSIQRQYIAGAIRNISISPAGKDALLANRDVNTTLTTMANQRNTTRGLECIEFIKNKLNIT